MGADIRAPIRRYSQIVPVQLLLPIIRTPPGAAGHLHSIVLTEILSSNSNLL